MSSVCVVGIQDLVLKSKINKQAALVVSSDARRERISEKFLNWFGETISVLPRDDGGARSEAM